MAALDMTGSNPWSRLTLSEFPNLHCLRETLRRQLYGAPRATAPRSTLTKPLRAVVKGTSYVLARSAVLSFLGFFWQTVG